MKLSVQIGFLIGCVFFTAGCSKEEIKVLSLEEKLIGTWEFREAVDLSEYLDFLWHEITPPYVTVTFDKDSTYHKIVPSRREIPTILEEEDGIYKVDIVNQDTIVTFISRVQYGWKLTKCSDNQLTVSLGVGREGEVKSRYFKVE